VRLVRVVAALGAALVLSFSMAAGATSTPLASHLLTKSQMPAHFVLEHLTVSDTATCPESSFQLRSPVTSVRVAFADATVTHTLVVEKLYTSNKPVVALVKAVNSVTRCQSSSGSLSGYSVSQSIQPVKIGTVGAPVRAFSVLVNAGPDVVDGYLAFATRGTTVISIGEASASALSVRGFRRLVVKALARIPR